MKVVKNGTMETEPKMSVSSTEGTQGFENEIWPI